MTGSITPKGRIFYVASISTDSLNRKYDVRLEAGAAANKVLGVCRAIRAGGGKPVIVSTLFSSRLRDAFRGPDIVSTDDVPFVKVFSWGRRGTKRIISSVPLVTFAMRHVRKQDRVILYNYYPETILLAFWQRLVGNPAILDIEDSPRVDRPGVWNLIDRICFSVMLRLCRRRYLVVSHQLARDLKLPEYYAIYGTSSFFSGAEAPRERFDGKVVKVLFGGAIMPHTGKDLFQQAVRRLVANHPDLPIEFNVTGHFPRDEFEALASEINGRGKIRMKVHVDLSAAAYREVARDMDIGLSLRMPQSSYSHTTFPSKVLEIAAMGMLLCSTDVSDIPIIFDDSNAVLLRDASPEELVDKLREAVLDLAGSSRKAARGRNHIMEKYSEAPIGHDLIRFILKESPREL